MPASISDIPRASTVGHAVGAGSWTVPVGAVWSCTGPWSCVAPVSSIQLPPLSGRKSLENLSAQNPYLDRTLSAQNIDNQKHNTPTAIHNMPVERQHLQPLRMFLLHAPTQ